MIVHNLKELRVKMSQSVKSKDREIKKELDKFLSAVVFDAKQNAGRNRSVATGNLINSIDRTNDTAGVRADYAGFVEFGTKAKTKIPSDLQQIAREARTSGRSFKDFIKDLKDWAKNKNIDPKAVYKIAFTIMEEGTEAKPFFYPAVRKNQIIFRNRLKKALKKRK